MGHLQIETAFVTDQIHWRVYSQFQIVTGSFILGDWSQVPQTYFLSNVIDWLIHYSAFSAARAM